jgi:hypothetical protein
MDTYLSQFEKKKLRTDGTAEGSYTIVSPPNKYI